MSNRIATVIAARYSKLTVLTTVGTPNSDKANKPSKPIPYKNPKAK